MADVKAEVEILRQAMLNEVEGAEFYKLSAAKFKSSDTKEALLDLAKEEERHYDYLLETANKLQSGKSISYDPEKLKKDVPSPGIYKWEKAGEDEEMLKLAVTVFSVAMNMEKDSVAFYEKAYKDASSDDTRKLYKILIDWEKTHLTEFQKQYDIFKQAWWTNQNFQPF